MSSGKRIATLVLQDSFSFLRVTLVCELDMSSQLLGGAEKAVSSGSPLLWPMSLLMVAIQQSPMSYEVWTYGMLSLACQ